jgi:hypothetical protein
VTKWEINQISGGSQLNLGLGNTGELRLLRVNVNKTGGRTLMPSCDCRIDRVFVGGARAAQASRAVSPPLNQTLVEAKHGSNNGGEAPEIKSLTSKEIDRNALRFGRSTTPPTLPRRHLLARPPVSDLHGKQEH